MQSPPLHIGLVCKTNACGPVSVLMQRGPFSVRSLVHWSSHSPYFSYNLDHLVIFLSIGISSVDNSGVLLGRPYAGCAIIYPISEINFTY